MKISLGLTILSALAASACALQGTIVTDSGPLRVRAEPNTNSAVVGEVKQGAQIEIDCYKRGQWITGRYSSDIWDHISTGYVSDAWVNTAGKLAPLCGGGGPPPPSGFTGTVRIDGGVLHIRSGPSTSNPIVGTLTNGATVSIECMTHSEYIKNGRYSSDIWDKIPQGWVSDAMIDTGGKLTRFCDGSPTTPPPTGGTIPGLTARQSGYARTIAAVARQRSLGKEACNVAIATALVESSLTVYCNRNVPGSCNLPHDAEAHDHLSVGIFQQQSPMWGPARDCMDPATSAGLFYNALGRVSNWRGMPIGVAAQKVQRSAFPDRYAGRANQAIGICNAAY
ncbi:hypothetical protein BGZ67_007185 [Mortierella alpina]|nr:hypothetical protein BGZ67_007185 [Mortierella alpina]